MWIYSITKGKLTDGTKTFDVYSGRQGVWKNNPAYCSLPCYGPTPIGRYLIGTAHDDAVHGPRVMRLTPQAGTDTHGRSGFLIHGDSIAHPGNASEGCIIAGPDARAYINASLEKELEVTV